MYVVRNKVYRAPFTLLLQLSLMSYIQGVVVARWHADEHLIVIIGVWVAKCDMELCRRAIKLSCYWSLGWLVGGWRPGGLALGSLVYVSIDPRGEFLN